jgi:hypothetical protein
MVGVKCWESSPKALTPNTETKSVKVLKQYDGLGTCEFSNQCTSYPLGLSQRGIFIGWLGGVGKHCPSSL